MSFVGVATSDLREIGEQLDLLLDLYWPVLAPQLGPELKRLWWRGQDSGRRYEMAADVDRVFAHLGAELDQVRRLIHDALRAQLDASSVGASPGGYPTGPGTQFA